MVKSYSGYEVLDINRAGLIDWWQFEQRAYKDGIPTTIEDYNKVKGAWEHGYELGFKEIDDDKGI